MLRRLGNGERGGEAESRADHGSLWCQSPVPVVLVPSKKLGMEALRFVAPSSNSVWSRDFISPLHNLPPSINNVNNAVLCCDVRKICNVLAYSVPASNVCTFRKFEMMFHCSLPLITFVTTLITLYFPLTIVGTQHQRQTPFNATDLNSGFSADCPYAGVLERCHPTSQPSQPQPPPPAAECLAPAREA